MASVPNEAAMERGGYRSNKSILVGSHSDVPFKGIAGLKRPNNVCLDIVEPKHSYQTFDKATYHTIPE